MLPSNPAKTGAKLLLADDSEEFRSVCAELLRESGFRVLEASDGQEAMTLWEREDPALILLDVNMPRMDGWQTLEKLMLRGCRQPVMMLTGQNNVADRVRGLGDGADDYIGKPCDFRELLARVQVMLRRNQPEGHGPTLLHFGDLTVDLQDRTATTTAGPLALTRTEYAILDLLARHHGRPVTRETILDAVWGYTNRPNTRTVETHIWRLRQKLGDRSGDPQWIRTMPGAGYQLETDPEPVAA